MSQLEIAVAMYMAYLVGSLSSAVIVCKIMGFPDPRTRGSHNPGATNVLRIAGKRAAFITLLGDVLKGTLPILVAEWFGFNTFALALIALGAFLGHLFPIFFRFEGGKGVATALGCLIALSPPAALCWIATWLIVAALFRYSSLAALTAAVLAPFYVWYFTPNNAYIAVTAIMAVLLLIRHHTNIAKLIAGTESKINRKK